MDAVNGSTFQMAELASRGSRAAERAGASAVTGDAAAAEAAHDLEALFSTLLVKEMRKSMAQGFFGEGSAADVYGGWFDQAIGDALAERGALDLAGQIKASLNAKTEAAVEAPTVDGDAPGETR